MLPRVDGRGNAEHVNVRVVEHDIVSVWEWRLRADRLP
jgi:hypothetical protein